MKLTRKQREFAMFVANYVRTICKEKACDSRCYHQHAILSLCEKLGGAKK